MKNTDLLTEGQRYKANTLRPIIADMNRSSTVEISKGVKILIYKYDEKHSAPMLTNALCFQRKAGISDVDGMPYNFTSPVLRDRNEKVITINGKVQRESSIAKAYRYQYKAFCKETYGNKWEQVFYHGKNPDLN